jgi:rod shape-determining protein MreD
MVRQYFFLGGLATICIVIQTTLLSEVNAHLHIDLIFAIVVLVGLYKDPIHGAVMSFLLGFLEDVMMSDVTGLYMSANMIIFMLTQLTRERLSPDTPLAKFSIGLGLGLFNRAIVFLLFFIFSDQLPVSLKSFVLTLTGTFINALAVVLLFYALYFIPGFVKKSKGPKVVG